MSAPGCRMCVRACVRLWLCSGCADSQSLSARPEPHAVLMAVMLCVLLCISTTQQPSQARSAKQNGKPRRPGIYKSGACAAELVG
jgi:hypothetical protein